MRSISHVEAVTVCIGYGDFLKETAKYNYPLFERWVIVTSPDDEETREVCRKYNLYCLQSEDHKRWNSTFAKGRANERGLQHLSKDCWRIVIDGDIVLPSSFRHLLEAADLEQDKIFGIDRALVRNWNQWQDIQKSGWLYTGHADYKSRVNFPKGFEMGTRWVNPEIGYVPIGFFQMWHSSQDLWRGTRTKPYPSHHNDACRTDVQHALQWDRAKRALIPEVIGLHLESEPAPLGQNWNGRKTKRFGPATDGRGL